MAKEWTKQEIDELVQILESDGIVTRENNMSLDGRNSRNIQAILESMGYSDFLYIEVGSDSYRDYSGAVYNINYYTDQEAREFMRRYILKPS